VTAARARPREFAREGGLGAPAAAGGHGVGAVAIQGGIVAGALLGGVLFGISRALPFLAAGLAFSTLSVLTIRRGSRRSEGSRSAPSATTSPKGSGSSGRRAFFGRVELRLERALPPDRRRATAVLLERRDQRPVFVRVRRSRAHRRAVRTTDPAGALARDDRRGTFRLRSGCSCSSGTRTSG
jgi:hypothetical protein